MLQNIFSSREPADLAARRVPSLIADRNLHNIAWIPSISYLGIYEENLGKLAGLFGGDYWDFGGQWGSDLYTGIDHT